MNWQIFVAVSIVASALSALLQKVLIGKKSMNPVAFAVGFQLVISFFVGIVLIFKGFHIPALSPIALNLLLMPFLYAVGNVAKFKSLKKIEASEFTVIFQVSTVVTVLVAVLFLGESFHLIEILGLALVIAAILLVTVKDQLSVKFSAGVLWALLGAGAYGVAFANDAYILRSFDLWTYTFLAFFIPGLFTLIYLGKDFKSLGHLVERESFMGFITSALFYTVAVLTVYYAYQIGRNAAQIASITPTNSILIVILAAIFLKERDRLPKKLTAAVLSVIGIILLR